MMNKMDKMASFFKRVRTSSKQETPDASLLNSPAEKDKEKAGTDKMEKAILFFKQRQRSSQEETPGISIETSPREKNKEKAGADRMEKEILFSEQRLGRIQQETAAISLQSTPEEKAEIPLQGTPEEKDRKKAGWISPTYSQSRTVHLDPQHMAQNRCLAFLDNVPEAEAYRVLRTQVLKRTLSPGNNTIMVTSALPGEGKTLTAINLAFTIAREFQHTVLLVDGDLKKQSIHKYLGCAGEKGLIDYLVDGLPVPELITWPGIEKMTLMSGGRSFHESAEILGSPRMKELISDMKGRYPERYIIFDVPSVLTGADVLTFASLVDQVIVVVQAGKTSMDDVKKAVQFLPKEKILGFVLNRC
jgi:non-specific protein-tyrosine kinase